MEFRPNRQKPGRRRTWHPEDDAALDAPGRESVRAKGELSRKRTVIDKTAVGETDAGKLVEGRVIAVRGQFVDVNDGTRTWPCTVRRILRTRAISDRAPVVVGDRVSFAIIADEAGQLNEGVIEEVHPRRTELKRSDGRRTHVIAANVDQALIVSSIFEPRLKPHLIDRYLVAAHAGGLPCIICLTKADLDEENQADQFIELYESLGYTALKTSTKTGLNIDKLRELMKDKATLLAGQSGVGKSSLLNAIEPGLKRATAEVSAATEKGRHTTTTAEWLPLSFGGAAVDTPGIRALDVAMVPLNELELHFVEFPDRIAGCRFTNCSHIHEAGCAIKAAVEAGEIDEDRYRSYVELFLELSESQRQY